MGVAKCFFGHDTEEQQALWTMLLEFEQPLSAVKGQASKGMVHANKALVLQIATHLKRFVNCLHVVQVAGPDESVQVCC